MVADMPWLVELVVCQPQDIRSPRSAHISALTRKATPSDSPATRFRPPPVLPQPRWLLSCSRQNCNTGSCDITLRLGSSSLSGAWGHSYLDSTLVGWLLILPLIVGWDIMGCEPEPLPHYRNIRNCSYYFTLINTQSPSTTQLHVPHPDSTISASCLLVTGFSGNKTTRFFRKWYHPRIQLKYSVYIHNKSQGDSLYSNPIPNTTIKTLSDTVTSPPTDYQSDTTRTLSQLNTFVLWMRVASLTLLLSWSHGPNLTGTGWTRRSTPHVVSPPVVGARLHPTCLYQWSEFQPAVFHRPGGLCQSSGPVLPNFECPDGGTGWARMQGHYVKAPGALGGRPGECGWHPCRGKKGKKKKILVMDNVLFTAIMFWITPLSRKKDRKSTRCHVWCCRLLDVAVTPPGLSPSAGSYVG